MIFHGFAFLSRIFARAQSDTYTLDLTSQHVEPRLIPELIWVVAGGGNETLCESRVNIDHLIWSGTSKRRLYSGYPTLEIPCWLSRNSIITDHGWWVRLYVLDLTMTVLKCLWPVSKWNQAINVHFKSQSRDQNSLRTKNLWLPVSRLTFSPL